MSLNSKSCCLWASKVQWTRRTSSFYPYRKRVSRHFSHTGSRLVVDKMFLDFPAAAKNTGFGKWRVVQVMCTCHILIFIFFYGLRKISPNIIIIVEKGWYVRSLIHIFWNVEMIFFDIRILWNVEMVFFDKLLIQVNYNYDIIVWNISRYFVSILLCEISEDIL